MYKRFLIVISYNLVQYEHIFYFLYITYEQNIEFFQTLFSQRLIDNTDNIILIIV